MVADMAADMEVHMVADMVVDKMADKVADMVADMFADIVAKKGTQFGKKKRGTQFGKKKKTVTCKKEKKEGYPSFCLKYEFPRIEQSRVSLNCLLLDYLDVSHITKIKMEQFILDVISDSYV